MKKLFFTFVFLYSTIANSFAQDIAFARKIVDTLCSKTFWGRGYTNDGMGKAADFLCNEFSEFGLKPLKGKSFFQDYNYDVNTFPGKMQLTINGKQLQAGKDFIVQAGSKGNKCSGSLAKVEDKNKPSNNVYADRENAVTVSLKDKLTMDVENKIEAFTEVEVLKTSIDSLLYNYSLNIENKFIKNFKAKNICGFVKGTSHTDSFIVVSAHYDHLGGLGSDVYFPGANDNASGVSLLLNLAKYYAKNPQSYNMVFILFSGEEAGLIGSKYFTEHPLIDLKKIRFLINTDLAGTGIDGITVCNATEFPKEFSMMQDINKEMNLLKAINPRGKAANSDHYWFTEKGVPSFFFYTLGGIKAYHDVDDIAATLPLNEHEDLFKLVVEFCKRLQM